MYVQNPHQCIAVLLRSVKATIMIDCVEAENYWPHGDFAYCQEQLVWF